MCAAEGDGQMKDDLNEFLQGWAFDPDEPSARMVELADGRRVLQLRVDMGVLQMELEGRPDGERPHGCDSVMDHYRALERRGRMPERLDSAACAELHRELMQYFARSNAYAALAEPAKVYADCEHVLDIIDLVSDLAETDEDAWRADQMYPATRLAHAEAAAQLARAGERMSRARDILEQAIADIELFYRDCRGESDGEGHSEFDAPPESAEVRVLRDMLDELEAERPKSREENLQKALGRALAQEDYERAAAIRDQLKDIRQHMSRTTPPGKGKQRKASPPSDAGGAS